MRVNIYKAAVSKYIMDKHVFIAFGMLAYRGRIRVL